MTEQILHSELSLIASDLRKSFIINNVNASGRLSKSLEVSISQTNDIVNGKLLANSYIDTVDTGRQSNTTNSGGLLEGIREWLKYGKYGLPNTEAVARAIVRNIARQGSYLHRNKIDRNIVSGVINDLRIDSILKALGIEAEKEVNKNIINLAKSF